jgi:hypothetical protein
LPRTRLTPLPRLLTSTSRIRSGKHFVPPARTRRSAPVSSHEIPHYRRMFLPGPVPRISCP